MLNECRIIEMLKEAFPEFIGDDAAVLPELNHAHTVITKDLLVEDVHFRLRYCSPEALAHKALHVNLSDLAAMGATPQYVMLGLSIPAAYAPTWIHLFLKSFSDACLKAGVSLIGGDTTTSQKGLFISVTAIGSAFSHQVKARTHAKPHAIVAVAGPLGYAHIGLKTLEDNLEGFDTFKQAFLTPIARVSEGLWFSSEPSVQAMMDTSDGVYTDVSKLCKASGLGVEIELENIQKTDEFSMACFNLALDPTNVQFSGGEDYGLLVVVDAKAYPNVSKRFAQSFGYALNRIGRTVEKDGVNFLEKGHPRILDLTPYSHF